MAISNISSNLRAGVCTSTTRPTAPYEGQTIYETDTDLLYVWSGSAWIRIYSSPTTTKGDIQTYSTVPDRLAVGSNNTYLRANSATSTGLEWSGNPVGLEHIFSGSFSAVTEYIPSTSVFSSTYDHYLVKLTIDSFVGTGQVYVQMRNSGGNAASDYRYAGYQSYADAVIVGAVTSSGATTNGFLAQSLDYDVTEHDGYGVTMDVMNPNRAIYTTASCMSPHAINAQFYARYMYQKHSANTAYTNLRVNAVSLTSITGNIKVYGYRNA